MNEVIEIFGKRVKIVSEVTANSPGSKEFCEFCALKKFCIQSTLPCLDANGKFVRHFEEVK